MIGIDYKNIYDYKEDFKEYSVDHKSSTKLTLSTHQTE